MSEDVSNAAPEAAPEVTPEVVEEAAENQESEVVEESAPAGSPADLSAEQVEAAQDIADAVDAGEITEEQAVEMIKKLTLKVDGQEIEEELPFEVDPNNTEMLEYLKKKAQLAAASQKRMQEAAELRKTQAQRDAELQDFLGRLSNQDELDAILKHFGHDPAAYAEAVLAREVERMEMSPEQRELEELRAEMKRIEDQKKAAEEARKKAEYDALVNQMEAQFENDLIKAMDEGKLQNNPYNFRKAAAMMNEATKRKLDVSFGEIVDIIKEENDTAIRESLKGLSADQILEILGEKQVNDIVLKKAPKPKKTAPPTADSIKEGVKEKKEDPYKARKRTQSLSDWMRPKYKK
jgi:hypothetical protein